jgi:hypothetical protein
MPYARQTNGVWKPLEFLSPLGRCGRFRCFGERCTTAGGHYVTERLPPPRIDGKIDALAVRIANARVRDNRKWPTQGKSVVGVPEQAPI